MISGWSLFYLPGLFLCWRQSSNVVETKQNIESASEDCTKVETRKVDDFWTTMKLENTVFMGGGESTLMQWLKYTPLDKKALNKIKTAPQWRLSKKNPAPLPPPYPPPPTKNVCRCPPIPFLCVTLHNHFCKGNSCRWEGRQLLTSTFLSELKLRSEK